MISLIWFMRQKILTWLIPVSSALLVLKQFPRSRQTTPPDDAMQSGIASPLCRQGRQRNDRTCNLIRVAIGFEQCFVCMGQQAYVYMFNGQPRDAGRSSQSAVDFLVCYREQSFPQQRRIVFLLVRRKLFRFISCIRSDHPNQRSARSFHSTRPKLKRCYR